MKHIIALVTVCLLATFNCVCAEEMNSAAVGLNGSDVYALLTTLEAFGIPTPEPKVIDVGLGWQSNEIAIKKVPCSYTIRATNSGEIISAYFCMNGDNNGLFNQVASITYDSANTDAATRFIKSNIGKSASTIIGNAQFDLQITTTVSTSSITIGSRTSSSISTKNRYILNIAYLSDTSGLTTLAQVTKGVNIRASDNSDSAKVGHASEGEQFVVLQAYYTPKWHQIEYENQIAYISTNYCDIITTSTVSIPIYSVLQPLTPYTDVELTKTTKTILNNKNDYLGEKVGFKGYVRWWEEKPVEDLISYEVKEDGKTYGLVYVVTDNDISSNLAFEYDNIYECPYSDDIVVYGTVQSFITVTFGGVQTYEMPLLVNAYIEIEK